MTQNKKYLAIIPARGGSKRLPRKNVLELAGKPLIVWSIEAGLKSKYIDKVVVTSDDNEILAISENSGAKTIKRPNELAGDTATTFDAIKHTIDNVNKYDYIILLQPTSPLRNEKHIDEAIELLEAKNADAVISVSEMDHSPLWANTLPIDLSMNSFLKDEVINKRSQDLEKYYRLNGAIYICKTEKLIENKGFFLKDNIFAYVMDRKSSVDIDEEMDFRLVDVYIDNNSYLKKSMADNIFKSYTRQGFGRLLKSEVDLVMFDFSLKKIFSEYDEPDRYFVNNELNYFVINKQDVFLISKELKITETKVISYIEQIGLLNNLLDKPRLALNAFIDIFKSQSQDDNLLKDGKLRCYIPNKLLKNYVEAKIDKSGSMPNYSFNKDILVFDLQVLFNILDINSEALRDWVTYQNKLFNSADNEGVLEQLQKKDLSMKDIGIDISKSILAKFVGESSGMIVDKLVSNLIV